MQTEVVLVEDENEDKEIIAKAGEIIQKGGLVAFPTETVYGLGGDALNPTSSQKIYGAKGRPSDNPLIIHIAKMEDLRSIVKSIPREAEELAKAFWPGPLTIVFEKAERVPYETTGGLETVAVRMPVHPVALSFIEAAGGYVAAPSANTSGKPSPTKAKYVVEDMMGKIDMILDGGDVDIGLESTIIDLTGEKPTLLRPGFITKDMLEVVLGEVEVDPTLLDSSCKEKPKAPGMRYKHYAPKGELTIISGEFSSVTDMINEKTLEMEAKGEKVGIIATTESLINYKSGCVKCIGSRKDDISIARTLFSILREFDNEAVTYIYSESFEDCGMGQAIMNRLLKAAGHQIIYLN